MAEPSLQSNTHTLESLRRKYSDFYAPSFEIKVNGSNLIRETMIAVSNITVEMTLEHKADTFSFVISNAYDIVERDFSGWDKKLLPGTDIEIQFGYVDKLETIFTGIITSLSYNFNLDGLPELIVRGMDRSFRMMHGNVSKTWNKKKYSDVVKEIAGKHALSSNVSDTEGVLDTISQARIDDYHFISQIADYVGYDFFIIGKTLYFRKPLMGTTPVVTLEWGTELQHFQCDVNIAGQVEKAVVRGWDPKEHKSIEGSANTIKKLGSNSKTGIDLVKSLGTFVDYEYTNAAKQDEAINRAKAILTRRGMNLLTGSGTCIGLPELQVGRYMKLNHVGKKLSQPFYITSVTHVIDETAGYVTNFTVGGNAI